MFKFLFHKLGIHNWTYHIGFFMYDQRVCKICNTVQRRKRNPEAKDMIDDGIIEEWKTIDIHPQYVRQ